MRRSHRAIRRKGGDHRHRSSWRVAVLLLTAALTAGGSGLLVAAVTIEPPRPPQPAAWVAPPELQAQPPSTPDPTAEARAVTALAMPRSRPARVRIPEIDVDANLISLGVDGDGEVEVPALDKAMDAGWYKYGPTPGEIGNAVIIGHVDSRKLGPAVFFELGALERGNAIEVVRGDGSVARFRVDGVKSFPKEDFPAELVYGPSDRAGLRVVTCGGDYDKRTGDYLGNVIVFATLRA